MERQIQYVSFASWAETMTSFPVAVFAFNRPDHLDFTLNALSANFGVENCPIHIYVDGPRNRRDVASVNAVIRTIDSYGHLIFASVQRQTRNIGLANSIIQGVSELLCNHPAVIVLEDDLVTSPYFLNYMNHALCKYASYDRVMSVSAFGRIKVVQGRNLKGKPDAYFAYRNSSWGWGTWSDAWGRAEWDMPDYEEFRKSKRCRRLFDRSGNDLSLMLDLQQHGLIDSWAIRWTYAHFVNDGLSLIPYYSYVRNIGLDGSGTHTRRRPDLITDLSKAVASPKFPDDVSVSEKDLELFKSAHDQKAVGRLYWKTRLLIQKVTGR